MTAAPDERRCPVCWTPFTPTAHNPQQRYCQPACRKTAWRRTHPPPPADPPVVPATGRRRDVTIYACPGCKTRYLAQQWCSQCNQPCRRIGLGGTCPNCQEPVAVTDLFDTETPIQVSPEPAT